MLACRGEPAQPGPAQPRVLPAEAGGQAAPWLCREHGSEGWRLLGWSPEGQARTKRSRVVLQLDLS